MGEEINRTEPKGVLRQKQHQQASRTKDLMPPRDVHIRLNGQIPSLPVFRCSAAGAQE